LLPAEPLPEPEPEDDDPADDGFGERWSVTALALPPATALPLLLAVLVVVHAFLAVVLRLCPTLAFPNDFTSCPICVFEAFDIFANGPDPLMNLGGCILAGQWPPIPHVRKLVIFNEKVLRSEREWRLIGFASRLLMLFQLYRRYTVLLLMSAYLPDSTSMELETALSLFDLEDTCTSAKVEELTTSYKRRSSFSCPPFLSSLFIF